MRVVVMMVLLALTACPASAGVPPMPRFRIVGPAEGLPSTMITALAQDRAGYLWMTTTDGLVRYDGVDFKVWRHLPGDRGSLASNLLQALYIDSQDRLWVALGGAGVAMLSADRSTLTAYLPAQVPALANGDVTTIAGQGDEVWFGLSTGALVRRDGAGRFTTLDLTAMDDRLAVGAIYALAPDAQGRMWVGTLEGVAYYDGQRLHRVRPDGDSSGVIALQWVSRRLWASMATGLRYMDASGLWYTPAWASMFAVGNRVWAVAEAGDGEYWLGTEQGLWHTRPGQPPALVNNGGAPLVSQRHVPAIWRSPDGGIWVPLQGHGLAYLREDWRRTAAFGRINDRGKGLACSLIPSARFGGLWQFDSSGRLLRYDTATGQVTQTEIEHPELGEMLITTGLEDRLGRLWLGSGDYGLSRLDLQTGDLQHWPDQRLSQDVAIWLAEPGDGTVWSGFEQAIQIRNAVSGRVLETISPDALHGLQAATASQLSLGPDGRVWIASKGGLFAWQPASGHFVPVLGLNGAEVQRFVVEDPTHLWIYRPGCLQRWRWAGTRWQRVRQITAGEGFPAMDAHGLERDRWGRLWMAGPRGLWRIDPRPVHAQIRGFGARDGLTSQEFSRYCLVMAEDGVLMGGTADGATLLVDTRTPDRPSFSPQMRVEAVSVQSGERRHLLPAAGGFTLAPDDRQLRVNLRLLSFVDPSANRYRTRLWGFDTQWLELGPAGMREFSSLPPGAYVLQMQGIDPLGNASSVQRLPFSVRPPWWRSHAGMVVLGGIGLALGLLLAAAYRRRVRLRAQWQLTQHKHELAEQASLAKTRFLATLGHEVRTPMTGVLGMSELLLQTPLNKRQSGYASAIQSAGQHLLRLVNDALDLARIEAGKLPLDVQDFSLRQLVAEVAALVQPIAEHKGLAFTYQLNDGLPITLHGDPNRVKQILLNLAFNATKFTEQGAVELRARVPFQADGCGVCLDVSDTGPGMSQAQCARLFQRFEQAEGVQTLARYGGSGLGLAICRELAVAMGGTISVDTGPARGSCFTVTLPLGWGYASARQLPPSAATAVQVRPQHLLLVEDDPTVAQVMVGLLQGRGHQVVHASHGLAALAEIQLHAFDVILCDLDLPGLDGAALVRQLRGSGRRLPIVAVTARADADAEPQAVAAGCNGFLRKPVTGELLAQALAQVLAGAPPVVKGGEEATR